MLISKLFLQIARNNVGLWLSSVNAWFAVLLECTNHVRQKASDPQKIMVGFFFFSKSYWLV